MKPSERIDRVLSLLSEASVEIEELKGEVPAYCLDATRFVKAEVAVVARRLENLRRVLSATTRRTG